MRLGWPSLPRALSAPVPVPRGSCRQVGCPHALGDVRSEGGDPSVHVHRQALAGGGEGLAQGLSCVLRGYDSMGVSTFNFAVYSGPLGEQDDSLRCYIRIISRQNVYENYRTDDYFLQKLLRNELILTPPEILATTMRGILEGK